MHRGWDTWVRSAPGSNNKVSRLRHLLECQSSEGPRCLALAARLSWGFSVGPRGPPSSLLCPALCLGRATETHCITVTLWFWSGLAIGRRREIRGWKEGGVRYRPPGSSLSGCGWVVTPVLHLRPQVPPGRISHPEAALAGCWFWSSPSRPDPAHPSANTNHSACPLERFVCVSLTPHPRWSCGNPLRLTKPGDSVACSQVSTATQRA